MTKKLWFRAKTYGWGWIPCSWEGWLVVIASIILIIFYSTQLDKNSPQIPYLFFLRIAAITIVIIFICYKKGEKPGWRWGNR
ncbi:MAG: hypothetical protein WCK60_02315 [Candidatus Nomurabacteria bacterium]